MTALASSLRSSQIFALTYHPTWTIFFQMIPKCHWSQLQKGLAKNKWEGHRLNPIVIPAWTESGNFHPLRPVLALWDYLDATIQASKDSPVVWMVFLAHCSRPSHFLMRGLGESDITRGTKQHMPKPSRKRKRHSELTSAYPQLNSKVTGKVEVSRSTRVKSTVQNKRTSGW